MNEGDQGVGEGAGEWLDTSFVNAWAKDDIWVDLLSLPRRLACALVANETPSPKLIVDIGSGPGVLLGIFLQAFPAARGLWVDVSPGMLPLAQDNLAPFDGRVTYVLRDMAEMAGLTEARGADIIMTSRAIHHLDQAPLRRFYAEAAALLAPGGWLINLDHAGTGEAWSDRYSAVRHWFTRPDTGRTKHAHKYPLASADFHLEALRQAGIVDTDIPWKGFSLCLFIGRKLPA